jgi:hypothetical protein
VEVNFRVVLEFLMGRTLKIHSIQHLPHDDGQHIEPLKGFPEYWQEREGRLETWLRSSGDYVLRDAGKLGAARISCRTAIHGFRQNRCVWLSGRHEEPRSDRSVRDFDGIHDVP